MDRQSRTTDSDGNGSWPASVMVVLVVGLFGAVVLTGGIVAADSQQLGETEVFAGGWGDADDVYVEEDGDAVFAYQTDLEDGESTAVNADVAEGLFHATVGSEDVNSNFENVSGEMTGVLESDRFGVDGEMTAERPENLADLSVDLSGEVSDERNEFDGDLSMTIAESGGMAMLFGDIATSGDLTTTSDTIATSGEFSIEQQMGLSDGPNRTEVLELSVDDTDEGYTASVTQKQAVSEFQAGGWESEQQARQTLESQYVATAQMMGGQGELTLESHDFERLDDGTYWIDVAFTVEYTGIEDGLENMLAGQLLQESDLNVTQDDAREIAASITDLHIETFEFSMAESATTTDVSWDIALEETDSMTTALISLIESADVANTEGVDTDELADLKAILTAQQASDLATEFTWNASMATEEEEDLVIEAMVSSDTDNWDNYVAELKDRGIDIGTGMAFSLEAATQGEEITADGALTVNQEDLVGSMFEMIAEDRTMGPEMQTLAGSIDAADLDIARMDMSAGEDGAEMEVGARFEDAAAMMPTRLDGTPTGASSETDGDTATLYVFADDLVDDGTAVTAADVHALTSVSERTTVHLPAEWDREFPQPNTEAAAEYLDKDVDIEAVTNESGPGFGVVAGLIGVVSAALLARRQ